MKQINFSKGNGLIPVVIQDKKNKDVLMVGFMNLKAYKKTVEEGYVYFWSRSRNSLWKKGETSGNFLKVNKMILDCDNDTLLIQVNQSGGAVCHTGKWSCFKN